jgi:hypothetical protein
MIQFNYDVAIACRVYGKMSSNLPPILSDDKLKLTEFCLKSLKASLGKTRAKLWVILNHCPPEYDEMFKRVWGENDLILNHYSNVPPSVTLSEAARFLREQTDAEFVYFACDDYFYLPDQFELAINFLKQNPDADVVSLYDHFDLHNTDLHKISSEVREFAGKKWRTCVSTTDTWMTRRSTLIELEKFLTRITGDFPKGHSPDLAMWMALTKKRVFNPFKFTQWSLTKRFWAASIFLAWYYCWRQILFGRRYTLWTPMPSISTHMVAGLEAPGIDWPKEFQRQELSGL